MYPTENLTTRIYSVHADLVRRAAAKADKSISEYVGDVVVAWAASDIGEKVVPLPKLERGRYKRLVDEAAKRAGMTRAQWERHAAETLSAQALGIPTPDDARAPSKSGERVAVNVGGYAKSSGEETRLRTPGVSSVLRRRAGSK
jgi:uncharacterized protein (DUF1778 family)